MAVEPDEIAEHRQKRGRRRLRHLVEKAAKVVADIFQPATVQPDRAVPPSRRRHPADRDDALQSPLDGGRLEYAGSGLSGLFNQRRNLLRPRFWSMLRDLVRFYRHAPGDLPLLGDESLGEYSIAKAMARRFARTISTRWRRRSGRPRQ